jgi:hypothetical protein
MPDPRAALPSAGGDDAIAAAGLGLIEGTVGALEALVDALARRPLADPEARRQRQLALRGLDGEGCDLGAQLLGDLQAHREVRGFVQDRKLLTTEPRDDHLIARGDAPKRAQHLVAGIMAVGVVDLLEVIHVEHDRGGRVGAARPRHHLLHLLEEGAAVVKAGQGIDHRQANELALHAHQPLRGTQPCVQLLLGRRLADELVGAAVERVDQVLLIGVRRHQDDVDRAIGAREQSRLPAQLHARHGGELGARDQRADVRVGLEKGDRVRPIRESAYVVAVMREHPRHGFEHRAAGIDHDDTHDVNP